MTLENVEQLQKLTTEANVRRKQHIEAKQQKAKRNEIAREHKIEEKENKTAEKAEKKTERERKKNEKEDKPLVKVREKKRDNEGKKEIEETGEETTPTDRILRKREEKTYVQEEEGGDNDEENDEKEEEEEGTEVEDGFIVSGVTATHSWRNKRYWYCD